MKTLHLSHFQSILNAPIAAIGASKFLFRICHPCSISEPRGREEEINMTNSFVPQNRFYRNKVSILSFVVLIIGFIFTGQSSAGPLVIQPGQDGFVTQVGSLADLPPLPAGFFGDKDGTPSDPTAGFSLPVKSGPDLVLALFIAVIEGQGKRYVFSPR